MLMPDDTVKRDLFSLIKSALTGTPQPLSKDFDLASVLGTVRKHQIENIVYYGAANCGIPTSTPAMQKLFGVVCSALCLNETQIFESERIFAAFEAKNIDFMPLKGTLLKPLYPKSDMRSMSDVDVLIKLEQYDKIRSVMQSLGFSEKTESDHELIWNSSSFVLELHKRIVPSYNKDFYSYFGDGWQLARKVDGTTCRYAMSKEDEYVYLFTHFAKHYRDGGVGIKHLTDFYVFLNAYPKLDRLYIEDKLEKLRLAEFEKNVSDTIAVWFFDKTSTPVTDLITDVVFNSGAYGTRDARLIAAATKNSKVLGSAKKARASEYSYLIFLPYDGMCEKYPILKKAKILLPFFWVYRLAEAVFKKRKKIRAHQKDINLTSDENVSEYKKMLNAVGLDFNFE